MIVPVVLLILAAALIRRLMARPSRGVPPFGHPDRDVEMSLSETCVWVGLTSPSNYSRDAS